MSHPHTHHEASYWTRRHTESVVLDIGDDVGALVLYTPADQHTHEIEVSLLGADSGARRVHSAVLERSVNGRIFYAATYPELPAGDYEVWCAGTPRVTVRAGSVTELRI
ncbi:MAG: phospholipase [Chloroflexi bacterium]|nr:phospholipase [Chloroflexota bacterium]